MKNRSLIPAQKPHVVINERIDFESAATPARYVDSRPNASIGVDEGFWIIRRSGRTVTLDLPFSSQGASSNYSAAPACRSTLGCQSSPLTGAPHLPETVWSLSGNPVDVPVAIDDMRVLTEAGRCSGSGCTLEESYSGQINPVTTDRLFLL